MHGYHPVGSTSKETPSAVSRSFSECLHLVNFDRSAMAIKSRYTLLNREQAWHSEYQMLPSESPSELA